MWGAVKRFWATVLGWFIPSEVPAGETAETLSAGDLRTESVAPNSLGLVHQTPEQFLLRFRRRLRESERQDAARLAAWLVKQLEAETITVAQVRVAFGLLQDPEWTAFRDRMTALRDHWVAVEGARGEA